MLGDIGQRFLNDPEQGGFDIGGQPFFAAAVVDADGNAGAPGEQVGIRLDGRDQAGIVERGRAQFGADFADARRGVVDQGAVVFHAFGDDLPIARLQGHSGNLQIDAYCRQVGAGAVMQFAGEVTARRFLHFNQILRQGFQPSRVLDALGDVFMDDHGAAPRPLQGYRLHVEPALPLR